MLNVTLNVWPFRDRTKPVSSVKLEFLRSLGHVILWHTFLLCDFRTSVGPSHLCMLGNIIIPLHASIIISTVDGHVAGTAMNLPNLLFGACMHVYWASAFGREIVQLNTVCMFSFSDYCQMAFQKGHIFK